MENNERETFIIEGYELRETYDNVLFIPDEFKANADEIKVYRNRWYRKRYKVDFKFNLNNRISGAIGRSLRGSKAGRHWEYLVGYTSNALIIHLKKTIPNGYTWEDVFNGKLQIDHKIPISAHNFTKPEHIDFKRCWALSNLQLLPAMENRGKKNKLIKPFQPSLKLEVCNAS